LKLTKGVITVSNEEPLMKAFTTLMAHKVSAVAVVRKKGRKKERERERERERDQTHTHTHTHGRNPSRKS
jgi:CBS domain-containing protein